MFDNEIEKILRNNHVLKCAFLEYISCISDVYSCIDEIIVSPSDTPQEFCIGMGSVNETTFSFRKNIFSTLFQSVYYLLGIQKERRELYGKLNHLFRAWVTAADNLLDGEDKVVIPVNMPGNSRIMPQVISIMAADRAMKLVLDKTVAKNIISPAEAALLANKSLQILLPSAAEEASEESGVQERLDPEYVLFTIHRLKTGLLFHIPFLGPEMIEEDIDNELLVVCKDALGRFGLGCQLLDDIRDMLKDYSEKKHNYVLSKIYFEERSFCMELLERLREDYDAHEKIFNFFPEIVYPVANLAKELLEEGLLGMNKAGLGIDKHFIENIVFAMFKILDVGELIKCAEIQYAVKTE